MLLVIHNLPSSIRYSDVKNLIQTHCALTNVILDNLINEGIYKKVTVGVANDSDAIHVVRKLDGLSLAGEMLRVEEVRQSRNFNFQDSSYNGNKSSNQWNEPFSDNLPSLMDPNSSMSGQNTMDEGGMMGQNSMRSNNMMRQNLTFMRPDNVMGHSRMMGPPSMMGQKAPIAPLLAQSSPAMVPPPLMGYSAPVPFSGPFYMSPQSNNYGNYSGGQQNASQYPERKDPAPSKSYGFPDTGSHRDVPDKTIPVWATDESNDYSRRYSGSERDRYDSRQSSSSRRTRWDNQEYESMGTREESKRPKPWADDPPYRRTEYDSFDRSYDHGPERYSRRQDSRRTEDSGTNMYQRRPYESSHSAPKHRSPPPGARKGPSRYDLRSREGRSPPPKRFRVDPEPNYRSGPTHPTYPSKDKKVPKKVKLSLEKIVDRDLVWRSQAAAEIVKEMLPKIKTNLIVPQNLAFTKMKAAVRHRLAIILNNRMEVKMSDQMVLYRRRFKTDEDQYLYNRVIRHILHEMERNPKEPEEKENAAKDPSQPKAKQPAKTILKLAPAPLEQVIDKLPKYPQGDKAAYKVQKKQFQNELKLNTIPEMDPVMKKAIDEEIEPITEIVLGQSVNPTHDGDSLFCKRITNPDIMDELKKMLALNVAKRVLNLGTVPLIRILGVPKPPKKAPLDEFLKTYGVTSLKKSDLKPMYIATCNSYESFDNICALKDVVIDNVKVQFKPMYLTAPPEKHKHKKKQQKGNSQFNEIPETNNEEMSGVPNNANVAVKEIKQEIATPVKNKASGPVKTEIKQEVATPMKNKPVGTVSTGIKKEAAPVKVEAAKTGPATQHKEPESKVDEAESVYEQLGDNSHIPDDDDYNEEDYEEYGVEDSSEVNEDDLEDY